MGQGDDTTARIEFKNGSLHVYPEDLSKIPLPLLERFGINCVPSHSKNYFPSGGSHSDNLLQQKINDLEEELQKAHAKRDQKLINELEQKIKDLRNQSKDNPSTEKSPKDNSDNT